MYKAETFWRSIDEIALAKGCSLGKLALSADMDASAFLKSRRNRHGLTLNTISKVLSASGMSITEWAQLVEELHAQPTHSSTGYPVQSGQPVSLLPEGNDLGHPSG